MFIIDNQDMVWLNRLYLVKKIMLGDKSSGLSIPNFLKYLIHME